MAIITPWTLCRDIFEDVIRLDDVAHCAADSKRAQRIWRNLQQLSRFARTDPADTAAALGVMFHSAELRGVSEAKFRAQLHADDGQAEPEPYGNRPKAYAARTAVDPIHGHGNPDSAARLDRAAANRAAGYTPTKAAQEAALDTTAELRTPREAASDRLYKLRRVQVTDPTTGRTWPSDKDGRPYAPSFIVDVCERYDRDECSAAEAVEILGVSHVEFLALFYEWRATPPPAPEGKCDECGDTYIGTFCAPCADARNAYVATWPNICGAPYVDARKCVLFAGHDGPCQPADGESFACSCGAEVEVEGATCTACVNAAADRATGRFERDIPRFSGYCACAAVPLQTGTLSRDGWSHGRRACIRNAAE